MYEVGDKVIIVSEFEEGADVTEEMKKFNGSIMTIESASSGWGYSMEEDKLNFLWSSDMIAGRVQELVYADKVEDHRCYSLWEVIKFIEEDAVPDGTMFKYGEEWADSWYDMNDFGDMRIDFRLGEKYEFKLPKAEKKYYAWYPALGSGVQYIYKRSQDTKFGSINFKSVDSVPAEDSRYRLTLADIDNLPDIYHNIVEIQEVTS